MITRVRVTTQVEWFDWSRLPQGWSLATSFDGSRNASKRCQTVTAPWREIYGALYAAGDFRLVRFNIAGKPAVLAVRGNWDFTDVAAANDIKRTVGMVRRFWHDNRFPRFLVTLAPYDQEHGSSDGSAFTDAFWMFVSNRDQIRSLLPQLAHESFHAWDPKRMGTIPLGYDERNIRWFNEGTTEYYAQLLTLRAGLLPMPTYISSLNEDLRRFPDSSDEYVRGRIISLWLDGTIRTQSHNEHSLDDVMFDMVKGSSRPYTFERLLQTIDHYLNEPTQLVLRLAILQQGDVAAPAQAPYVGACAFATQKSLPTFDLGFDLDSSRATMTVSGVKEGGPAFTAGLRDGQKLKGFSFAKWDSDKLASVRVSSASGEQRYSFYPRGRLEDVWQYETVPNANCAITSKQ